MKVIKYIRHNLLAIILNYLQIIEGSNKLLAIAVILIAAFPPGSALSLIGLGIFISGILVKKSSVRLFIIYLNIKGYYRYTIKSDSDDDRDVSEEICRIVEVSWDWKKHDIKIEGRLAGEDRVMFYSDNLFAKIKDKSINMAYEYKTIFGSHGYVFLVSESSFPSSIPQSLNGRYSAGLTPEGKKPDYGEISYSRITASEFKALVRKS